MANKRAAIKALRQTVKRHTRNKDVETELRTLVKKARVLIDAKKREEADAVLKTLESKLDRAAKSKIIRKENASRRIARLRSAWAKAAA
jgi:small subunit ribosomal protein S20